MPSEPKPALQIVKIMSLIYDKLLTSSSGGNISIKDKEGNIWITPAAKDKGSLKEEDICCVKPNNEISGIYSPSSELPFHKDIYKVRSDVKAIVHAHSVNLLAFSTRRKVPQTKALLSSFDICKKTGLAKYAKTGTNALALNIAGEFKQGAWSVIMENHGVVVGGKNLNDAFERFETFENLAQTILGAQIIDKPIYLFPQQIIKANLKVQTHSLQVQKANYSNIIDEYCKYAKRAYMKGLIINRYASLSYRIDKDRFLISNPDTPFWNLSEKDILIERIKESKESIHSLIYKYEPDINSIIISQSPAIMSFAISTVKPDMANIPESLILLKEIPVISFDSFIDNSSQILKFFNNGLSSVLIRNHSIIVTGSSIHESFNRLEVAENTAKSIIAGKTLGAVSPVKN